MRIYYVKVKEGLNANNIGILSKQYELNGIEYVEYIDEVSLLTCNTIKENVDIITIEDQATYKVLI